MDGAHVIAPDIVSDWGNMLPNKLLQYAIKIKPSILFFDVISYKITTCILLFRELMIFTKT